MFQEDHKRYLNSDPFVSRFCQSPHQQQLKPPEALWHHQYNRRSNIVSVRTENESRRLTTHPLGCAETNDQSRATPVKTNMKFNFQKKRSKKLYYEEVSEGLTVTKVRVMTESPSKRPSTTKMPSTAAPDDEIEPSSPTCVKEQAVFDTTIGDNVEAKESDVSSEWSSVYNRLSRNYPIDEQTVDQDSSAGILSNEDDLSSEALKRWEELTTMMNITMEDIQEKYFSHPAFKKIFPDDLGEFAMSAVEKNRSEIDELFGKIDRESRGIESGMADLDLDLDPMNWLQWDNKEEQQVEDDDDDETYDNPIITCSDLKTCLKDTENSIANENDVFMMVHVPQH